MYAHSWFIRLDSFEVTESNIQPSDSEGLELVKLTNSKGTDLGWLRKSSSVTVVLSINLESLKPRNLLLTFGDWADCERSEHTTHATSLAMNQGLSDHNYWLFLPAGSGRLRRRRLPSWCPAASGLSYPLKGRETRWRYVEYLYADYNRLGLNSKSSQVALCSELFRRDDPYQVGCWNSSSCWTIRTCNTRALEGADFIVTSSS